MSSTCYVDKLQNRAYKNLSQKAATFWRQKFEAKKSTPKDPIPLKKRSFIYFEPKIKKVMAFKKLIFSLKKDVCISFKPIVSLICYQNQGTGINAFARDSIFYFIKMVIYAKTHFQIFVQGLIITVTISNI